MGCGSMNISDRQTGSALIILIGVMLMVLLLGAAVVSMRSTASFSKPEINTSSKAFYLAESGKRFADFSFSQGKSYPQTYRLSGGDEFQLAINTKGIESTGMIYQNSIFETIRNINGLPKSGLPCWNFDNISKPGKDSCGLNDGTLSGLPSPVVGRFGFGNALQCNGSGWMETPFKPIAEIGNGKAFSISFWVKPDNITQQVVLGVSDGIYRFSVGITSAGKWFWAYGNKTEFTSIGADIGYWQKVMLVYTGKASGDKITLHVSKCSSYESAASFPADPLLPIAITDLFICAEHTSLTPPTTSFPFSGLVDDIRIYDRALIPAAEVILNCGLRCDAKAVAYYSFNGNANDSSGHNNNGTVNGAVLTHDRFGCPNRAYRFDGSGDYIRIPDHNSLTLGNEGTLAAWIYTDTFKNYAGIIHKGTQASFSDEEYSLQFWNDTKIRLLLNGATPELIASSADFKTPSAGYINSWHHIAVTWNSSGSKFYVDGNINNSSIKTANAIDRGGDLMIGSQLPGNYYFDGRIDEVVMYNRALSADEIALLANADDS